MSGGGDGGWRPTLWLAGSLIAAWAGLLVFPALRALLFLGFFSAVLATVLSFPINLLDRLMPRWLATLVTLLLFAGLLLGVGWLVLPPAVEQAQRLAARLPAAAGRIEQWLRTLGRGELVPAGLMPEDPQRLIERLRAELGRLAWGALPFAMSLLMAAAHALAAVVLAFFIAHRPGSYRRGLLALVPAAREGAAAEVLAAMVRAVRTWTGGILLSMTAVGTLTAFGLWLVGIDVWFALGVLAFFGEFIPYAGPILSAIPGLLAGLSVSPTTALWVGLVYLIVQQLEGNLIQPLAMRWAVRISPGLLIVWQIAFATAFGLPGLLVATPLLAALQAGIQKGFIERTLGKGPGVNASGE